MQRELEAERKAKADLEKDTNQDVQQPKVLDDAHNRNLAAQGVYFRLVKLKFSNFFYSFFGQTQREEYQWLEIIDFFFGHSSLKSAENILKS